MTSPQEGVEVIARLPIAQELPVEPTAPDARTRFGGLKRGLGRAAAFGAVTIAGGAGFGALAVHLSEAPTTLGPHEATVRLTSDGNLTLGLGPFGKIVKPLDQTPMGEGVHIDVGESPLDPSAHASEQAAPEAVIGQYAGFFSNSDRDIEAAKESVWNHFKGTAEFGGLAALSGSALLYTVVGAKRRRELLDNALLPHKLRTSFVAAALTLNMVPAQSSAAAVAPLEANPIFAGTPLEGAHVTGQFLTTLTDTVLPKVLGEVRANKQFYDQLLANLQESVSQNSLLAATPDTITLMHTSDKHCNMNVNKLLGVIAREARIDQVIDTGDSVLGGTPLDNTCTDSNNYYLKKYARVVVEGNHRSPDTAASERKKGAHVLEGEVTEVGHVRYLGNSNRISSGFAEPTKVPDPLANAKMGEALADTACADSKGVDIIVGATPDAVRETLRRGCAKLALAGGRVHNIETVIAQDGKQLRLYEVGTTGGVKTGAFTMGPLQNPATVALIQIDKFTHEPKWQQTITFYPDARVIIGPIVDWTAGQPG